MPNGKYMLFLYLVTARNLSISAKSAVQELYVDGLRINLTFGNNWTVADEIELSNVNRLISVYAVDLTSTCAGILASVTDDYLVTDSKWKCTTITTPQWYSLGFDDTDWVEAYVIGPNGNVSWPEPCKVLKEIPAISQNAYWIWTSTILNAPYYDPVIYCRAYLRKFSTLKLFIIIILSDVVILDEYALSLRVQDLTYLGLHVNLS